LFAPTKPATNGVAGLVVELLRRAHLLEAPGVHHGNVIGQHERFRLVVGDVDERRTEIRLQLFQLDFHVLAQLEIERAQRLVEQQQRGLEHEAPRDRHPLLLAAGQLIDALVLRTGKADPLQHRLHTRRGLGARNAARERP
jgi:hypothetical protein